MYGRDPWLRLLFVLIGAALLLFAIYPSAVVFLRSVQGEGGRFTLLWYQQAFLEPASLKALANTGLLIAVTPVVAVLLGALMAWVVRRTDMPMHWLGEFVPILPLLMPPLVGAMGWVFLLAPRQGFANILLRNLAATLGLARPDQGPLNAFSLSGMVWAIAVYIVPYAYTYISDAFRSLDASLEEAALVCGASPAVTLWRISLPLVTPAVLSGALLAFIVAGSEFAVAGTIGIPAHVSVLSTRIYEATTVTPPRFGLAAALGSILMLVTIAGTIVQNRLSAGQRFISIGSKGFRSQRIRLGPWRWVALALLLTFSLTAVVLPLGAVFVVSLMPFWKGSIEPARLSLRNYAEVLSTSAAHAGIVHSLVFAAVAATAATAVAVIIATIALRTRLRGRRLLEFLGVAPMGVPAIVFSVGAVIVFVQPPLRLYGTLIVLPIVYAVHFLPFVLRSATSALLQIHPDIEEAAFVAGEGVWSTLWRVVLPLLGPSLASGWAVVFILATRELPLSVLLVAPGNQVMATVLWSQWIDGTFPQGAAFAVVMFLISCVVVLAAQWFGRRVSARWEQGG